MYCKRSNLIRFAKVGEHVDICPDLAMSPSQMSEMVQRGIPITTNNLRNDYIDGLPPDKLGYDVPIGETRGVDFAEVWQAEKTARKRMSKAQIQNAAKLDNPSSVN